LRWLLLAACAAFHLAWALSWKSYNAWWYGATAVVAAAFVLSLRSAWLATDKGRPVLFAEGADGYATTLKALTPWLVAAAGAVLALIAHRPDADDCTYHNYAATLANGFFEPRPEHYTDFAFHRVPHYYPTFPLIAFHDVLAVLSRWTNIEPLAVSAFIVTPIASGLLALAYAMLLRTILPAVWPWALLAVFSLMVIDGSAHNFFSNYAYVRIWQGKSILMHVGLPVIMTYGLWYGSQGGLRRAVRLTAGVIAVFGLGSTGVWMGPVAAGMGVAIGALGRYHLTRDAWPLVRRLLLGTATTAYPIVIGLALLLSSIDAVGETGRNPSLEDSTWLYFGYKPTRALWFAAMSAAGLLAPGRRSRLFCATAMLLVLATFGNPFLSPTLAKYVTHAQVYYRIIWLMPLPVIGACVLCTGFDGNFVCRPKPLRWLATAFRTPTRLGVCVLVVAVALYAWCVPTKYVFASSDRWPIRKRWYNPWVRIGWPSLKVPVAEYEVASFMTSRLPAGSAVMGPEEVTWLLSCFRNMLHPIAPQRQTTVDVLGKRWGLTEVCERYEAAWSFAEGSRPLDAAFLQDLIADYDIRGIATVENVQDFEAIDRLLAGLGFRRYDVAYHHVWLKSEVPRDSNA